MGHCTAATNALVACGSVGSVRFQPLRTSAISKARAHGVTAQWARYEVSVAVYSLQAERYRLFVYAKQKRHVMGPTKLRLKPRRTDLFAARR